METTNIYKINRKLLILCVPVVITSTILYLLLSLYDLNSNSFDDSYIFLRYAKHFLSGYGYCWNIGEKPTYGCTSIAYMLFITLFNKLANLNESLSVSVPSWLFGLSSLFLTLVLIKNIIKDSTLRLYAITLTFPAILLSSSFYSHSITGMDTTMSLFGNLLLAIFSIRMKQNQTRESVFLCVFIAWLDVLIRPDNGIYALMIPLLILNSGQSLKFKKSVIYILSFTVIITLDLIAKYKYFGTIAPLSFYVKRESYLHGYTEVNMWNPAVYLCDFIETASPFLIAIVLFLSRKSFRICVALLIPVLFTTTYYFTVVQIMGFSGRFYFPSLAFIITASYCVLNHATLNTLKKISFVLVLRATTILIIILIATSPTIDWTIGKFWFTHKQRVVLTKPVPLFTIKSKVNLPDLERKVVFKTMTTLLKPYADKLTIATTEIGYIGANLPNLNIIDMAGLNNKKIAFSGFSIKSFIENKPDVILMPQTHYVKMINSLLKSPDFRNQYTYYSHILDYGLALKKDSPYFKQLQKRLKKITKIIYSSEIDINNFVASYK